MAVQNYHKYSAGINNVGSYMVSGRPWVRAYSSISSGTQTKVEWPKVTKTITVINMADVAIRIFFADPDTGNANSSSGNGPHYIELDTDEDSFTMNIRVKELWILSTDNSSAFTVYAELTNIEPDLMYSYDETGIAGITD